MQDISPLIRKAYFDKLSDLKLDGIKIPCFDEYVPDPKLEATLKINGGLPVKAHVKITNQTSNDASNKCATNFNHTIQLDITTTFPANSGGYITSERIANEIFKILCPIRNEVIIETPTLNVWKGLCDGIRKIPEENKESYIFRTVLIFSNSIQQ